jgi:hypothetical protein
MEKSVFGQTKKISLAGILAAMAVIAVFLASILPTSRISLYVLSSFFISIVIIESGVKTGWMFYLATSFLIFIVVNIKVRTVPYIIFFGLYGIIKFYIEKANNLIVEVILKLAYFNLSMALLYNFAKQFFLTNIDIKISIPVLIVVLEMIFAIYDYIYTLFIKYYIQKLRKILKIG